MTVESEVDVTVVIPCYRSGGWLGEAVDSVAGLTGGYRVEVIVVDDGSDDDATQKILDAVAELGVLVIRQANAGPAAARNRGIEAGSGRYILPLDADDRLLPRFLEATVPVLEAEDGHAIAYGRAMMFGESRGIHPIEPYAFPEVLVDPRIYVTALFRRRDWEAVGGYRESMREGWEDFDFWLGILGKGGRVHFVDEVLFEYRQTGGSRDQRLQNDQAAIFRIYRKLFEQHTHLYLENLDVFFQAHLDRREWWNLLRSVSEPVLRCVDAGVVGEALVASAALRANGEWQEVRFILSGEDAEAIRLHLYDGPCEIEIGEIVIGTESAEETFPGSMNELVPLSLTVETGSRRWLFADLDPRIEVRLEHRLERMREIRLRVRIEGVRSRLKDVLIAATVAGREAEGWQHELRMAGFRIDDLETSLARANDEVTEARAACQRGRIALLRERSLRRGLQGSDCVRIHRAFLKLWGKIFSGTLFESVQTAVIAGEFSGWDFRVEGSELVICRAKSISEDARATGGWEEFRVRRLAERRPLLPTDEEDLERRVDLRGVRLPAKIERLVEGQRWERIGTLSVGES